MRDELRETSHDLQDWLSIHATSVLVSVMIVLILLGFARIYTITQDLQHQQHAACELRIAGRNKTNAQIIRPMRSSMLYLASIGAHPHGTPAQRKAATAFRLRFLSYAAVIQPFPNPKC